MGVAPSRVFDDILQGGFDVLEKPEWFEENNVTHVVSLGNSIPKPEIIAKLKGHLHYDVTDVSTTNLRPFFVEAVHFIHAARQSGDNNIYIHCAAGVSRSSTITLAYMMSHLKISFEEALQILTWARSCVCPNGGFRVQLKEFEADTGETGRDALHEKLKGPEYPRAAELREKDLARIEKLKAHPDEDHY